MNKSILVKTAYIVMTISLLVGSFVKILHYDGADILLAIGLIAYFVFLVITIYEVYTSTNIREGEKVLWIIGLLLLSGLVGILYILIGRKKIVSGDVKLQ